MVTRGSNANPAPSAAGLRKRAPAGASAPSKPAARSRAAAPPPTAAQGLFSLRMYNDEAPGIRVGPTTVLVTSLVYIAIVIMLHIWAKFR
ncbi:Protein transport protein Sec61 subunit beta [Porphyridium purpureum]|uniref:Protein transport protein Sec61 subunit beta n=1 Tax=Porphyridium purpureum TaxID=35688 RepID=A0A5J4Z986_PORPP|nr:Protein transport protein Sec61 subunit beta [Porphyridium purpureum]|eukprot:POR3364..scf295_1